MQTQRRAWKRFQQYNVVNFVVSSCVVATLVLHLADAKKIVEVTGTHGIHEIPVRSVMLSPCASTVQTESALTRKQPLLSTHAQHSAIRLDAALVRERQHTRQLDARLNALDTDQHCIQGNISPGYQNTDVAYRMSILSEVPVIPGTLDHPEVHKQRTVPTIHFVPKKRTVPLKSLPAVLHGFLDASGTHKSLAKRVLKGGTGNIFSYGQCTWWADQRYHQLHGIFVPWRVNANAFQWVARAVESGWRVSGLPTVGSIMVLQPGVDGAYGFGHVGVVERILQNGRVIASSMNWGSRPGTVTQSTYVIRPGVSFISSY